MFKDKKIGDSIYILEIDAKTGKPKLHNATVSEISDANYETNAFGSIDYTKGKKIELKAELSDNSVLPFAGINPDNNLAIGGKYRISTDKDRIHEEVKRIYEDKQEHINRIEEYKDVVEECKEVMQELGIVAIPVETDKRLDTLEKGMKDIQSMLSDFISKK